MVANLSGYLRRRKLLLAVPIAVAGGAAYLAFPPVSHGSDTVQSHPLFEYPTPAIARAVTMNEAWRIAAQAASSWSPRSQIAQIESIEGAGPGGDDGTTGAKVAWRAALIAPDKPGSELIVTVVNGMAVSGVVVRANGDLRAIAAVPVLDSSGALQLARAAQPELSPASDKRSGYAFATRVASDGRPVVTVLGSYRGLPASVEFDARSGQLIGSSARVWARGGVLYSGDGGATWRASNLVDGQVVAVSPVPGQAGRAFALKPTIGDVELWETVNGGQFWLSRGTMPLAAGTWAYGLTIVTSKALTLIAGAPSGLWVSANGGSWTRPASFPSGPPQWLSTFQTPGVQTAVVTVSAGQHQGVYASEDLASWRKVLTGVYRLSSTTGNRAVIALADSGSPTAYLVADGAPAPLSLTVPNALRAGGSFAKGGTAVIASPQAVLISVDGGSTWKIALQIGSTDLAVSPDVDRDGVILVAGLRNGIFRSADRGQHWQHVLEHPEAIISGSGLITSMTFLSLTDVVAVNGGVGQWMGL